MLTSQFRFRFLNEKLLQFFARNIQNVAYYNGENAVSNKMGEYLDPVQKKLLDEVCIVVDKNDQSLCGKSKKDCHLMENIKRGLIHRAFSVFLFNSKNELLLQQRSSKKITFPEYYTNTCCSHPLFLDSEMEKKNALGVKRAAVRRLEFELGIPSNSVNLDDFHYMTRILYSASSDSIWGENEIDYILILQKDVKIERNPNEVADVRYVSRGDMPDFLSYLRTKGCRITPWFDMIVNNFLYGWWDNLHQLETLKDQGSIHVFKNS
ncbi:isopentenyl-diphosphate Delta-isomerase 1-like [Centruroides sculpturatus]|uniref:isopentenyl-diphosphate Delta-isomerase 1-like n=1 Tax=Centruroides sculpturatus TaxID=218467 RepID=UPI000C6E1826|nr:isopentenyl-diphosphate Delta-isomerase 1-like [Centruroides sculpturatus]